MVGGGGGWWVVVVGGGGGRLLETTGEHRGQFLRTDFGPLVSGI